MNKYNDGTFERISKTEARKIFESCSAGKIETLYIAPCNVSPSWNLWGLFGNVFSNGQNFDTYYNTYCYYNCNNEVGRYPTFYKKIN